MIKEAEMIENQVSKGFMTLTVSCVLYGEHSTPHSQFLKIKIENKVGGLIFPVSDDCLGRLG